MGDRFAKARAAVVLFRIQHKMEFDKEAFVEGFSFGLYGWLPSPTPHSLVFCLTKGTIGLSDIHSATSPASKGTAALLRPMSIKTTVKAAHFTIS